MFRSTLSAALLTASVAAVTHADDERRVFPARPNVSMDKEITTNVNVKFPNELAGKPLVMQRYTLRDVERNGRQPLGHILIPQGWKAESSVRWTLASCYAPVEVWQRYSAPDGTAQVEFLPTAQGAQHISPFGASGTAPPESAIDALKSCAGAIRPGVQLFFADEKSMPWQRTPISATGAMFTQAASIVVRYEDRAGIWEEEFAGKLVVVPTAMDGFETRSWFIQEVRVIKSRAGRLDQIRPIGVAMSRSARATPEFEKAFEVAGRLVVDLHRKILDIQRAEREMYLQTHREINEQWRRTVEERWIARERQQEQFQDVLGGVNRFKSGSGDELLLPLSHKYAWEDRDNEIVIMSNDPGYRPDVDFRGRWSQLTPKH